MSSTLYQIYKSSVFELLSTMVVNHVGAAKAVNRYLTEQGYSVDSYNTSTWRYYLNMAGVYHTADLDNLRRVQGDAYPYMTIMIAGTNGPVTADFTAELLLSDTATANEYQYGTPAYRALVARYPAYEALILGIINPVPLAMSTTAYDGEILICGQYIKSIVNTKGRRGWSLTSGAARALIEDGESNLITELQRWIDAFLVRWDNPNFSLTDDLYTASFLGVLYSQLPMAVLNIRLANCNTPQAHSYHIQEYAESFGYLSQYVPDISAGQGLYLYRNLRYLGNNPGKQSTFSALVENILDPSRVPLAGYSIRHDLTQMPTELTPTSQLVREPINFNSLGAGGATLSVEQMLKLEIPCAKDNDLNIEDIAVEIADQSVYSEHNNVPTKILQSDMIDSSDAFVFPLLDMLLNMWLYTASTGSYTGNIYVTHPTTGVRLQLTPLNAFILTLYCLNKGLANYTLETIPTITARLIPRRAVAPAGSGLPVSPSLADLKDIVSDTYVSEADLINMTGTFNTPFQFTSPHAFYAGVAATHAELLRRYFSYAAAEDIHTRAQLESVAAQFYWDDVACNLNPGLTYTDWLNQNGISLVGMQSGDYLSLATDLIARATGNDFQKVSLADIQAACLAIISNFSSYGVQYISSINKGSILVSGFKCIRYSDYEVAFNDPLAARITRPMRYDVKVHETGHFESINPGDQIVTDWSGELSAHLGNVLPKLQMNLQPPEHYIRMKLSSNGIKRVA